MIDGMLVPGAEDPDAAAFWQWCAKGELRIQMCTSCDARRFPPRPMCPACRSFDHVWTPLSGRGTVWSFVVPHPPLLAAYGDQAPYNVIVVTADEDPAIRFVGNLVTAADARLDAIDPASIVIGEPVTVVFDRIDEAVAVPRWTRP